MGRWGSDDGDSSLDPNDLNFEPVSTAPVAASSSSSSAVAASSTSTSTLPADTATLKTKVAIEDGLALKAMEEIPEDVLPTLPAKKKKKKEVPAGGPSPSLAASRGTTLKAAASTSAKAKTDEKKSCDDSSPVASADVQSNSGASCSTSTSTASTSSPAATTANAASSHNSTAPAASTAVASNSSASGINAGWKSLPRLAESAAEARARTLEAWNESTKASAPLEALESTTDRRGNSSNGAGDAAGGKWDQFKANKELFGVPDSTFDENLYTTPLDRTSPEYASRLAAAEAVEREILASAAPSALVAEERAGPADVPAASASEEAKHSAVLAPGNAEELVKEVKMEVVAEVEEEAEEEEEEDALALLLAAYKARATTAPALETSAAPVSGRSHGSSSSRRSSLSSEYASSGNPHSTVSPSVGAQQRPHHRRSFSNTSAGTEDFERTPEDDIVVAAVAPKATSSTTSSSSSAAAPSAVGKKPTVAEVLKSALARDQQQSHANAATKTAAFAVPLRAPAPTKGAYALSANSRPSSDAHQQQQQQQQQQHRQSQSQSQSQSQRQGRSGSSKAAAPAPWVVSSRPLDEASYSDEDEAVSSAAGGGAEWSASADDDATHDSWSATGSMFNDDEEESSWSAPVRGPKGQSVSASSYSLSLQQRLHEKQQQRSAAGSASAGSADASASASISHQRRSKVVPGAVDAARKGEALATSVVTSDAEASSEQAVQALKRKLKRKQHVFDKISEQAAGAVPVSRSSVWVAFAVFMSLASVVLYLTSSRLPGSLSSALGSAGAGASNKQFTLSGGAASAAGAAGSSQRANVYIVERAQAPCIRVPQETLRVAEHMSELSFEELAVFYDTNGDGSVSVEEIAMAVFPDTYLQASQDLIDASTQLLLFVQRRATNSRRQVGAAASAGASTPEGFGPCKAEDEGRESYVHRRVFSAEVASAMNANLSGFLNEMFVDGAEQVTEAHFASSLRSRYPASYDSFQASFSVYDRNSDGRVSLSEFRTTMAVFLNKSPTDIEVTESFLKADSNGNDMVEFSEYVVMQHA